MSMEHVKDWAPFQIDALGMITLIGADKVDRAIGRLTRSHITDWLPFLGVYKVSGDDITQPIPGYVLYNITDGILAPDLAGWFARWILCQNISFSSTTIRIGVQKCPDPTLNYMAQVIGILVMAPPMILSFLLQDWWGFVACFSMVVSVIVRRLVLHSIESALDSNLKEEYNLPDEIVKLVLTTPSGDAITIITSRLVVLNGLLTTPRPQSPTLYRLIRAFGWAAFGAQVVSLGMSCLIIQLITVSIMCLSTILVVRQVGSNERRVGSGLVLTQIESNPDEGLRPAMYARLWLSGEEEDSMVAWGLFPQRSNKGWWNRYRDRIEDLESGGPQGKDYLIHKE